MNYKKYFEKYGKIYGVSEKFSFGHWDGYSVMFRDLNEAKTWLHREEHGFRERRLCSLYEVKKRGYYLPVEADR